MSDTKDTGLTAATLPLDGSEIVKVVQGGNDRKATGESDGPRFVITTSTQTINSGAANLATDITQLVFTMVSGATYYFKATIFYTLDVTTTGTRWTVNTTGGAPTTIHYNSQYTLTTATWTYNMDLTAVQLPAASNATSVVAANTATIEGTVTASAAGTLIVQGAREVTTSSTAIVVAVGSTLQWQRIT